MYTLRGELTTIGDVQQVTDSFKKRDFVVVDASGQYAQTILFQAAQDRTDLLDNFKTGENVEVTFFLRGREWTNPKDGAVKVFNTLDCWKIESLGGGTAATPESAETFEDDSDEPPF